MSHFEHYIVSVMVPTTLVMVLDTHNYKHTIIILRTNLNYEFAMKKTKIPNLTLNKTPKN